MKVLKTSIPDVLILTPTVFEDSRGAFSETYHKHRLDQQAPGMTFVQDNESYSANAFTVRGLHYQSPPFAQAKLVRCTSGRIFDVAVDVRKGSTTYGKWAGAELSASNRKQLLAPTGFLHGFMTLEPDTVVSYKVTAFYDREADGAVHWASLSLAIDWPAPASKVTLSEKDASAADFAEFQSPFSV